MFAPKRFDVIRNNIEDLVEVSPLAALIDVLPASCALLDRDGVILAVNEVWREFAKGNGLRDCLFGVGQNYLETCRRSAKSEPLAVKALEGIQGVLSGRREFSMEYPCHSADEKRWFLMTASSLGTAGAARVLLMHTNITERVVAEQEVHAKCHELHALIAQRAEYEKRLDEFYSMVSHDIRSPMCSIVATMQFVTGQVGAPLGEVEVQLLRDSQVAASQVVGLVSDYLDHKKIAEQKVVLEKSRAKASEIVGKAHAMLRGLAQQTGVEVVMQNDESELVCNENAMVRVMVNLLTNAIKFTPEGKRIHLQARRVWDTTKDGQGFVEFVVADEGVGMTESTLAKVFEPFSVTTPSHVVKGSGLGMAIVKQLLEQHEAAVDVVSKPDVGTRVSFVLPSV